MTQQVPQTMVALTTGVAADTDLLTRGDGDPRYEPKGTYTSINDYPGAVTLSLGDAGALVRTTSASAHALTIPPNASVAFPHKTRIDGVQWGAGVTTITAGSGVTIRSDGGKVKSGGQYTGWSLTKVATDEWWLTGSLVA